MIATRTGRGLALAALGALIGACASMPHRSCRDSATVHFAELRDLHDSADSLSEALEHLPAVDAAGARQAMQAIIRRVDAIDACAGLATPMMLREAGAAGLAARALGISTAERAYRWSRRAVVLDSADRRSWRLMARAWDELQVQQNRPQWFGTVYTCGVPIAGRCILASLDTSRVSDLQRLELGLRSLAQQRRMIDSLNRARRDR